MNKRHYRISIYFFLTWTCFQHLLTAQFSWPQTVASRVFQSFLTAYNSGSKERMKAFIWDNYKSVNESNSDEKTDYWLSIFHRYGSIEPRFLSINKEHDLEIWMQATISKAWFAPELIIDKKSGKIKATAMLQGMQPEGVKTPSKNRDEFLSRLSDYLEANTANDLFQGVVAIQKDDQVIFHRAYGMKNRERSEQNTIDTRMRISSITKVITAIACLQLVQQGKLNLHKAISVYLPELPKHIADKITLYHLMTHSSGYELDGIDGFREELEKQKTLSDVFKTQLKYLPKWEHYQSFQLPLKFDYSNDSYDLIALIIERVSGIPFPRYINSEIFQKAGMQDTSFETDRTATPYVYDLAQDKLIDSEFYYPYSLGFISGASNLKSTTSDLLKLFNTLIGSDQLLDFANRSLLFAPLIRKGGDDYHSIAMTVSYDQNLNIGHNGTGPANSAELRFFPKSKYLLIVLCNNRSGAQNLFQYIKNNLPEG